MEKRQKTALIINSVIIILEIIGSSISLSGTFKNLIFYTVLSNILTLISSVFFISFVIRGRELPAFVTALRFAATVCLSVTFLIVVFVFVPMALPYGTADDVLYKGAQIYHHISCPILSFISFTFFESGEVKRRDLMIGALPTFLYAVVLIILNVTKIVYGPYPFLHVYEQPWFLSVMWGILIPSIAVGVGAVVRRVHNKRSSG